MNQFYFNKASVPRRVTQAGDLKEALGLWGTDRLLHVANACHAAKDDTYRFQFGRIHKRYANMAFLISEAIANNVVEYTAETLGRSGEFILPFKLCTVELAWPIFM